MRPGGPWQRLCRCPLESSDGFYTGMPLSYLEPARAVIVRCPLSPSPLTRQACL